MAKALAELMEESNQVVPSWLSEYAQRPSYGGGGRNRRYGGGGRRRRFGAYDYLRDSSSGGGGHYSNSYGMDSSSATLEVIQKKRTEKPEVRDAAREAALVPRPHLFFEAQLVYGKSYDFGPINCPEQPETPFTLSDITYGKQKHEAELKYP